MKRYYYMTVTGFGPGVSQPYSAQEKRDKAAKKEFKALGMDDFDDLYFLDMDENGSINCYLVNAEDL